MPKTGVNENGNGAEPVADEEEANARRQTLKQIGLTAGALVVAALGSSGASAQDRKGKAKQSSDDVHRFDRQPDEGDRQGNSNQSSDAEHQIIERALKDEEYRRRLIANPNKVIGEEVGSALPPGVQFKVLQETRQTVYLVLPYMPAVGGDRVSEGDLQSGAVGLAFTRSWFRSCPCRCSSLSVCGGR